MENKHSNYIHPELYTYDTNPDEWERKFLKPELMSDNWELYVHEELLNIYTIPAFTDKFCDFIMEEAEACNCWTVDRHESYPTTDMVLGTIGLGGTYEKILKKYIWPLSYKLFKLEKNSWLNMSSENFIARYHPYAQYHLSLHHDASQITTVVTLNEDFEGGGTYFPNQNSKLKGRKGDMSIHPGQVTHWHGGLPVESGQRYIIVSFCTLKR